jgi:hypothetical protein
MPITAAVPQPGEQVVQIGGRGGLPHGHPGAHGGRERPGLPDCPFQKRVCKRGRPGLTL